MLSWVQALGQRGPRGKQLTKNSFRQAGFGNITHLQNNRIIYKNTEFCDTTALNADAADADAILNQMVCLHALSSCELILHQ
jgi:hypothetical protein